jgi:hypothetical protein
MYGAHNCVILGHKQIFIHLVPTAVFGRCSDQFPAKLSPVLTDDFRDCPQSLQDYAGMVPEIQLWPLTF